MNSLLTSGILLGSLVAVVLLGRAVRRRLPDDHLSADSRDAVKLAVSLVATMTALLLGLLINSAKGTYDTQRTEVIVMASKVSIVGRVLAAYGPDAAEARTEFRDAVAEAVRRMWPGEAGERAELAPDVQASNSIYAAIQGLTPRDDVQRGFKEQAATLAMDLGQIRALMMAQMAPSIPRQLLVIMACWLVIIFFCFSLLAPPNATATLALLAAAISVAAAVFLITELDQPFGGVIRVSSEPMLQALNLISK